ncbi:hypothetical protein Tco_1532906 [Tanacetum coccineum]
MWTHPNVPHGSLTQPERTPWLLPFKPQPKRTLLVVYKTTRTLCGGCCGGGASKDDDNDDDDEAMECSGGGQRWERQRRGVEWEVMEARVGGDLRDWHRHRYAVSSLMDMAYRMSEQ